MPAHLSWSLVFGRSSRQLLKGTFRQILTLVFCSVPCLDVTVFSRECNQFDTASFVIAVPLIPRLPHVF